MRRVIPPQSQFAIIRTALKALMLPAAGFALLGCPLWLSAQAPPDQTPAPESTPKPAHIHKRPSPAHHAVSPAPDVPVPVTPPEPEKPNWPAFDHPAQASVVWDSHGLKIDATNSSLQQILKDVATATGVKVDGMSSDQRVFGTYGPGQARDVLSQLLQGSGYNVIMIGDQGQGTPRQILLSTRQSSASPAAAKTGQANSEDDDADEPPAPQEPEQPVRPAFPPGTPPRSPQQIMQEMQQRQQQIQQQQNQPQQPQQPTQPQQPQN